MAAGNGPKSEMPSVVLKGNSVPPGHWRLATELSAARIVRSHDRVDYLRRANLVLVTGEDGVNAERYSRCKRRIVVDGERNARADLPMPDIVQPPILLLDERPSLEPRHRPDWRNRQALPDVVIETAQSSFGSSRLV